MTAVPIWKAHNGVAHDMLPPFDVNAEEAVIASLLVDDEAFDRVQGIVQPEHFFRDENRWAFEACAELWRRNESMNQVTLAHELSRMGKLDQTGGIPYISRIVGDLPTPIGVEHFAGIVKRDAIYRQMITNGSLIVQLAYQGGPNQKAALDEAERLIGELRQDDEGEASGFGKQLEAYWNTTVEAHAMQTCYGSVDRFLCGLRKGEMIVVAARPGMGKSAWMLNVAVNASRWQNLRGLVFSLEMSRPEWTVRALARETGIDSKRIAMRELSDAEEGAVMQATSVLHELPLTIDDRPIASMETMRARARAAQRNGLDYVMVDYLQLITPSRKRREQSRYEEVTEISRGLKLLARELEVPVIAACQLNRDSEARKDPRPLLSDLRDSGAIEQDADKVVMLFRPEEYFKDKKTGQPVAPGEVEMIVRKHRNGPKGTAKLRMDPATSRFSDPADEEQEAAPWAK